LNAQGYENYVPEWVEDKETAESAFKRNLKEAGFEIVKLTTHNQHYNFNPFETVLGSPTYHLFELSINYQTHFFPQLSDYNISVSIFRFVPVPQSIHQGDTRGST
jgi:hypothetical protein